MTRSDRARLAAALLGFSTLATGCETKSGGPTAVKVQPPTEVAISPQSATIGLFGTVSVDAGDDSVNYTFGPVTWMSSNRSIADLSPWPGLSSGDDLQIVTGYAPGTVTISATELGVTGTATIVVTEFPAAFAGPIAVGAHHACAVAANRVLYCWGLNAAGQLGDGTTTNRSRPIPVAKETTFVAPALGANHSCALYGNRAFCWGDNQSGQLGDGTTTSRTAPTLVTGSATFSSLTAGDTHTCGLNAQGVAYCWGANDHGQLGDGTTIDRTTPTAVAGGLAFTVLVAGGSHSCGITKTGVTYCWGSNAFGQLGDGTTVDPAAIRSSPGIVAGGYTFSTVVAGARHSCGIVASKFLNTPGAAYCWGSDDHGQIGDDTPVDPAATRSSPTPVAGGLVFMQLAAGAAHTCGLSRISVYCWGDNSSGQLGDGTTTDRYAPTEVGRNDSYEAISVGASHSCGLTYQYRAFFCWGSDAFGQLGSGEDSNQRR